eukprot:gnl/TRDRNA2_/TRDRNA2_154250_c0_seq1.p1 gnl/TRDRNA2_/TRDRNA2_154250_c0~~gnl/TRDRNA2_/TRDRNA2_154250_c0_seq1.p1  ORF type:complete len:512 (-),score=108.27 gnl/TRDRNA2_/TRDRNA2_154250_c0_seq1:71-1606(-)
MSEEEECSAVSTAEACSTVAGNSHVTDDGEQQDVATDMQSAAHEGTTSVEGQPTAATTGQPSPKPMSWAQRMAKSVPQDSTQSGYAAMSVPEAPPVPKDSMIDYLLYLADRGSESVAAVAAPEVSESGSTAPSRDLPEGLRRFEQSLQASGVSIVSTARYARLGLRNDANNCYVNVVIQSLLSCSALMWLLSYCTTDDPRRPFYSCLARLGKEFHSRAKPDANGDARGEVCNPLALPEVKGIVSSWRKLGAQQDAGEFLFYLLSGMHDECKWKVPSEASPPSERAEGGAEESEDAGEAAGNAWAQLVKTSQRKVETREAGWHEDSPILRVFGGLISSFVRSKGAKADSVTLEPFNHLDLDISSTGVTSVMSALAAFCGAEGVYEGEATRRLRFKQLPKVLLLNLKRFTYNKAKGCSQKVKKAIKYEGKLIFDRSWLADDCKPQEYFISAVVCHHGESVHGGHYTAMVRYNSQWYLYDDTTVRMVDVKEVAAQQSAAYLLMYQSPGAVQLRP